MDLSGRLLPGPLRRKFLSGRQVGGASLIGRRSVFAHAVHCRQAELERMGAAGASISHCPISQQFLGSGTMPWRRTVAAGVNISAGTDFGAGDGWPIPRVLNAAFKAHICESGAAAVALDPAEFLFLGTLGGARALDMEDRFGNFDVGKEADFVVAALDARSDDPAQTLFALLIGIRETSIVGTYVQGHRLALSAQPPGRHPARAGPVL